VTMLQSLTVLASAHLVKYSIAVIMYLAPDLLAVGLIGPTKSIAHSSNTCRLTCGTSGISSLLEGFSILSHTSHD